MTHKRNSIKLLKFLLYNMAAKDVSVGTATLICAKRVTSFGVGFARGVLSLIEAPLIIPD